MDGHCFDGEDETERSKGQKEESRICDDFIPSDEFLASQHPTTTTTTTTLTFDPDDESGTTVNLSSQTGNSGKEDPPDDPESSNQRSCLPEPPRNVRARAIATSSGRKKESRNKPGVILLGRGNSFSLGRSEVILLHSRPRDSALASIQEQATAPLSPPPISERVAMPYANGGQGTHLSLSDDDSQDEKHVSMGPSLQLLWRKAEQVMAVRRGQVQKVLESFGIGECGEGGGGEEDGRQEEEQIWTIVQESSSGRHP